MHCIFIWSAIGNVINQLKKKIIMFLLSKTPVVAQKIMNAINIQLLILGVHFKCQDREETS